MSRKSPALAVTALSACLAATTVSAYEVQHESHVHGAATLDVVMEGQSLLIGLNSPQYNIVGFEHAANSAEDKAALEQAHKTLESVYELIQLPAAATCLAGKVEFGEADEHSDHEGHEDHGDHDKHEGHDHHDDHEKHDDHAKHDHHDEHKGHDDHEKHAGHDHHDEHKGHDDHEGHDHSEGAVHSDIQVQYSFTCVNPAKLDSISLGLFKAFPRLETLQVNLVSESGAQKVELNAKQTVVNINP